MERPVSTWFPGARSWLSTRASVPEPARRIEFIPESCKECLMVYAAGKNFQRCDFKKNKQQQKTVNASNSSERENLFIFSCFG